MPITWLTVEEAADRLNVSKATIRRWAKRGSIQSFITPGGQRRFSVDAVDAAFTPEHDGHQPPPVDGAAS